MITGGMVSQFYLSVLVVHVLVAVLGVGSVASVAIMARTARSAQRDSTAALAGLSPVLRYSRISLGLMLPTGILLGAIAGATIHGAWWFRGSALLLVATIVLQARAVRAVRDGLAASARADGVLLRVERIAYAMCTLVAAIAILMELKPF